MEPATETRLADVPAQEMYDLVAALYPICRSITGEGVRETLRTIGEHIDLDVHEVPSGTQVFDWRVPREWNIEDAYVANLRGERVIDFRANNLHVLNYSIPVRRRVSRDELLEHLFSLPDRPDWTPYRTSYYEENWGFCLPHEQLLELRDDSYDVCIDSSLVDGNLTYAECHLPGASDDEILVYAHVCHPSLANDNLSGVAVAAFLAQEIATWPRRYSYRFLFAPGTIGSTTWLATNEQSATRIKHGLVLAGVGDPGPSTYKRSRVGDAEIDRAVIHVLRHSGGRHEVREFSPLGYDERQFCSPGFNLPVGCLMRTPYGEYPEYHTSADDLKLVRPESLADSFAKCVEVLQLIERNVTYVNLNPKCEPQLGRRGLYAGIGGTSDGRELERAFLWILNLSDGGHSLLDIAERSELPFDLVHKAASELVDSSLLHEIER